MAIVMTVASVPVVSIAEDSVPVSEETVNVLLPVDRSIPTSSKHAYDPFAQLESEEATRAYRESVKYEDGQIIYKVTETKFLAFDYADVADADELNGLGIALSEAEEISRKKVDNGIFTDTYEVIYSAPIKGEVWDTVDSLAEVEGVVNAQPNFIYEDTAIDVPTISKNPDKDKQWHHGPDHLNCDKHWQHMHDEDITAGEGVVVAVIDTGVDYTHVDLASNMWVNSAEFNGAKGVDDDGNGYVDDIYGCSTVGAKSYHKGDPMDDHGHGTHVAGIIAMTANNNEGGVGISYGTKIMAIKAGQATGVFNDTDIAEAINYAVAMGADVINMSFGGTGRSFLVEEALSDAFGIAVLVAAAGNEGIPTADAPDDFIKKADFYPAGYSFVLGVMATDQSGSLASFSNWDYYANGGSAEYELTAPGVDIYSTLPGDRYASWDGTSMAAPVVSAAAALVRSKYPDRDVYSSRFIMGQLSGASGKTTSYADKINELHIYSALDIDNALNLLPKPNITVKSTYLFDDPAIDPANDGDGIIDAGETVDLGIVLRNQWGMATDVTVTVDAVSDGGVANPNIEFITDTVVMNNIGTFNEQNNAFVYDKDGLLVGTDDPIRFKVKSDCINDAHIGLNIKVTASNAFDTEDTTVYEAEGECYFYVQRGRTISGEITEDMTLTSEDYWIVENSLYIPEGVTVTVEPGTQLQFWSSDASDPYAKTSMAYIEVDGTFLAKGTEEAPIDMFPSAAFSNYAVDIRGGLNTYYAAHPMSVTVGRSELSYVNVINPRLNFNKGDHLNIIQDDKYVYYREISSGTLKEVMAYGSVSVNLLTDSTVNNMEYMLYGEFRRVYFEDCYFTNNFVNGDSLYTSFVDCVFSGSSPYNGKGVTLKDLNSFWRYTLTPQTSTVYTHGDSKYISVKIDKSITRYSNQQGNSLSYYYEAAGYLHTINSLLKSSGGALAEHNNDDEKAFINKNFIWNYLGGYVKYGENTVNWLDESNEYLYENRYSDNGGGTLMATCSTAASVSSYPFLLEFPSDMSDEEVIAAATRRFTDKEVAAALYESAKYYAVPVTMFTNNAILNNFNETDTSKWSKLTTSQSTDYFHLAPNNYFGTDDKRTAQLMINDKDTYASLADIFTEPMLTLESPELETIYPFVTEAYLTDTEGNRITSASKGQEVELHVYFNRDMDTEYLPLVSYGPAKPYTDYYIDGEFEDVRHWSASFKLSGFVDAGREFIRIKDARAADDKWLLTGSDDGRFAFDVVSTGAEALTLQAEGKENKVELSWTQDDYDTLAGFNVYRSKTENGSYTKINKHLIPGTIREYVDTEVEPGVEYFYYFTVMGTDLAESNPSNITSATPLDNIKPTLTHTRVTKANSGESVSIKATATDNIGIEYVKLFWRQCGSEQWKSVNMSNTSGNVYFATISGNNVTSAGIEYYVEASDGVNLISEGSDAYPVIIAVDNSMVIYSVSPSKIDIASLADGVTATVTGVNYSETMTLTVGGAEIPYEYVSPSQITFTVPQGSMGRADVVLADGERTVTLGNAITYTDSQSRVQITAVSEATSLKTEKLPITVSATGEVLSVDLQISLKKSNFSKISFENAVEGAVMSFSTSTNLVKVGLASSTPIANGLIGYLVLTPSAVSETVTTPIEIASAKLNAVDAARLVDTNLTVKPSFTVSGKITYYAGGAGIEGVTVKLSDGKTTVTDENGYYEFTDIVENNVTVTPYFSGNVNNAVTAQDAHLVLTSVTGDELVGNARLAADVDGDGEITSHDAAFILQKNVGIITGAFPGSGAEWTFDVKARALTLKTNATGVNFTAILLGDVSGNWTSDPIEELD